MLEFEINVGTRAINISTSVGTCKVIFGEWQGFGERVPNEPHLLKVDELILHDVSGRVIKKFCDKTVLVCHGHRPDGNFLKTISGFSILEIIKGLRAKGQKVDALVVCDQQQSGDIQILDLEQINPPVIYAKGAKVRLVIRKENSKTIASMMPEGSGRICYTEYEDGQEVAEKIYVGN